MKPRAALVIPVLDQKPDWLARCVRSALDQSVATETCAVVSSRTPTRIVDWLRDTAATAPRLRIMTEERPGFAAAVNTGIRAARAPRVGLLLSDDWLEPTAVAECLPVGADIVSTGLTGYAEDGRTTLPAIGRIPTEGELARRSSLEGQAAYLEHFFLFSRAALLAVGGVDERVGLTGCDDYDLIWALLERGASVGILPRRLYNYRDHDGSRLTLRSRSAQLRDLRLILDKHAVSVSERARILLEHARWFGYPSHVVASDSKAAAALGADLEALVAARAARLIEVLPMSPRRGPSLVPRTFRLRFSDGLAVKGRNLENPSRAAVMRGLLSMLDQDSFARVLARRGSALIEEWVDGDALDEVPVTDRHLQRCGRVLARLHTASPASVQAPAESPQELAGRLDDLVDRGLLERASAVHAAALARCFAPARASSGLCHGDFCGENIVIRVDGSPCVIDNETIAVGLHDYDLARTWYRWPLGAERWREFLGGYAEARDPGPFLSHFPYWAVCVLVDAFRVLCGRGERDAQVLRERMRELLEDW